MLVRHHVKYKEIHGEDKIILMDKNEHDILHRRLRKEGKCKIPSSVLSKITNKTKSGNIKSRIIYQNIDNECAIGIRIKYFIDTEQIKVSTIFNKYRQTPPQNRVMLKERKIDRISIIKPYNESLFYCIKYNIYIRQCRINLPCLDCSRIS